MISKILLRISQRLRSRHRHVQDDIPSQQAMRIFHRRQHDQTTAAAVVSSSDARHPRRPPSSRQYVELGDIDYVNLTPDGKHGDCDVALAVAKETGRPIFANFVEWSG